MRMALIDVIGSLFREMAFSSDVTTDVSQTQRQLNKFYDLLLERMLDISSYVRAKVLSVLSRLCDIPVKFPKQRLAVTRAAVDALMDKAAGVRKGAIILLVKLVVTHPYGLMHGGLLGLREWEERYQKVGEELEKVEATVGEVVQRGADESTDAGDTEDADEDEEEDDQESIDDGWTNGTPLQTPRRFDLLTTIVTCSNSQMNPGPQGHQQ
jgi:condensin complex subunit 1